MKAIMIITTITISGPKIEVTGYKPLHPQASQPAHPHARRENENYSRLALPQFTTIHARLTIRSQILYCARPNSRIHFVSVKSN
jgi:hypothetical protein